jgi:hypothetical protein
MPAAMDPMNPIVAILPRCPSCGRGFNDGAAEAHLAMLPSGNPRLDVWSVRCRCGCGYRFAARRNPAKRMSRRDYRRYAAYVLQDILRSMRTRDVNPLDRFVAQTAYLNLTGR